MNDYTSDYAPSNGNFASNGSEYAGQHNFSGDGYSNNTNIRGGRGSGGGRGGRGGRGGGRGRGRGGSRPGFGSRSVHIFLHCNEFGPKITITLYGFISHTYWLLLYLVLDIVLKM